MWGEYKGTLGSTLPPYLSHLNPSVIFIGKRLTHGNVYLSEAKASHNAEVSGDPRGALWDRRTSWLAYPLLPPSESHTLRNQLIILTHAASVSACPWLNPLLLLYKREREREKRRRRKSKKREEPSSLVFPKSCIIETFCTVASSFSRCCSDCQPRERCEMKLSACDLGRKRKNKKGGKRKRSRGCLVTTLSRNVKERQP